MDGVLGPLPGSVTLDVTGGGALRFAPAGEQWDVFNISVICSSNTNEATATVYKGQVGAMYRLSGTYAGSSGDNNQMDTPIHLNDGEALYVVWEGGDSGAIATATITGTKSVVSRGFRAGA